MFPPPYGRLRADLAEFDPAARRVLLLTAVAAFLAAYGGSVLFFALPAIANDFAAGLTTLADAGSSLAAGSLLALVLGALADRRGRRLLIVGGVLAFSLADLASAGAGNLALLTLTRVAAVPCETAVIITASVLAVEEVPASHRALASALIALAAGLGGGLTALVYPLVAPDWRLLYLPAGLGLPAALAMWRWLPEGRRWSSRRSPGDARALVSPPWRRTAAILVASAALAALFAEPANLLAAYFASRVLRLGPAAISLVAFAGGIASFPAYLAGGLFSDRAGRRLPGVASSLLAAAAGGFTFAGGRAGFWTGSVLSSFFAGAGGPVLSAWTAELLPTRARAAGEAAVSVAASLGGIVGLQAFARSAPALGLGRALALSAAGPAAAALLLLLLRETRGSALED